MARLMDSYSAPSNPATSGTERTTPSESVTALKKPPAAAAWVSTARLAP